MAIDLKSWLKDMGVKEDKIDAILPDLSPAADNIEKSTLRLADYSRNMDQLKKDRTALEAANDRLNNELAEFATMQAAGEPVTKAMRDDLAKAKAEVTRLQTVITTRSTELGLDPKDIIGEAPVVKPGDDKPAVDLTGYAKVDDLNQRLSNATDYFLTLPADLAAIQHEHQQLTGEFLDTRAIVAEVKRRATDKSNRNADGTVKQPVDVRAIWEETHQIAEKRTAQAAARHDKEIKDAEERGFQRARSESTLPGESAPGRHAPVFRKAGETREHMVQHAQRPTNGVRNDRISQATSAFATGKYRGGAAGKPAA